MLPRPRPGDDAPEPALRLFDPGPGPEAEGAERRRWRVDAWPITVLVWTVSQWESLPTELRPADAQLYPCGVRVALRADERPRVAGAGGP